MHAQTACLNMQKTPTFQTNKNLHKCKSRFTCFCKLNINQTFINGGGMIWGVRIAILSQTFGGRIDHLFVYFWTSKTAQSDSLARLHESLSISSYQLECNERGFVFNVNNAWFACQKFHSYCELQFSCWKCLVLSVPAKDFFFWANLY